MGRKSATRKMRDLRNLRNTGRRRAKATLVALAGKGSPRRTPWIAGGAVAGVVCGVAGTVLVRRVTVARDRARAVDAAAAVAAELADESSELARASF